MTTAETTQDLETGHTTLSILGLKSRTYTVFTHISKTITPEGLFPAKDGQALLLYSKDNDKIAILIPVYRPSKKGAYRMMALEKASKPFRWQFAGESEVEIWKRIQQYYRAELSPSWRPDH